MFLEYTLPLSLFAVSFAIFMSKNPVHGVLAFVVLVAQVVLILITLNLEFLAFVLAIVYMGAIVVLFLFVVMMFYVKEKTTKTSLLGGSFLFAFVGFTVINLFVYYKIYCVFEYTDYLLLVTGKDFVTLLSYLLFNDWLILTFIAAFLMLIGIIGAIILTIKAPLSNKVNPAKVRLTIKEVLTKKN